MRQLALVVALVSLSLPAAAEPPSPSATDVAVKNSLKRQTQIADLSQSTSGSAPTVTGPAGGKPVFVAAPRHEAPTSTGASASRGAGSSRDVNLPTAAERASSARPNATPRVLRRMNVERVVAGLDAAIRECADREPAGPATTVVVRASVAPDGTVDQATAAGGTAPPSLSACVAAAVGSSHVGAPGGAGVIASISVSVPAHTGKPAQTTASGPQTAPAPEAPAPAPASPVRTEGPTAAR